MTTTYKGYEIDNCTGDRFIVRLHGEVITTIKGSLSCVHFVIDSNYEDMTPQPVDPYEDLDLEQAEGEPTSEEINQAHGVKFCSFMAAVEANTKDGKDVPVKEVKLTEEQKAAYYEQDFISQKYYELERSQNIHI